MAGRIQAEDATVIEHGLDEGERLLWLRGFRERSERGARFVNDAGRRHESETGGLFVHGEERIIDDETRGRRSAITGVLGRAVREPTLAVFGHEETRLVGQNDARRRHARVVREVSPTRGRHEVARRGDLDGRRVGPSCDGGGASTAARDDERKG